MKWLELASAPLSTSKSALPGELELARKLAEQTRSLVAAHADGADFYKSSPIPALKIPEPVAVRLLVALKG